jgi:hypothetical protein
MKLRVGCIAMILSVMMQAQQTPSGATDSDNLKERVQQLESQVKELRQIVQQLQATAITGSKSTVPAGDPLTTSVLAPVATEGRTDAASAGEQAASVSVISPEDRKVLDYLHGTTIDVGLDTYYEYNFNDPVGRVNLLRAYDVLSNEFSLSQASVIIERAPDVSAGRRWGGRLDLQFGQATDTLQGNPSNEPRPQIYQNIFQAFGSYVLPFDKGVQVDFGKWGSSLGIEGNYTKDQMNYSRSYWFNFLPFYHMGVRTSVPVGDKFSLNYWIVNGTNQVEATNGFKDELWGFTAKPMRSLTWTFNYYLGQEHPDRTPATNCGPVPVQPGLCFAAISPAPNGHTDIFDNYATWQATKKLTFAAEGDYFIQRLWQHAAPGRSSAPSHVDGGAAYVQYQLTPKFSLASRAEYMSDREGLFSGITQALKENTVTLGYQVTENFLVCYEWRRDYSNQPTFLSDQEGVFRKNQTTAGVGLIWWWGRKEGSW